MPGPAPDAVVRAVRLSARALAAVALGVALALGVDGCSPPPKEGATRQVRQENASGVVVLEGQETVFDGTWKKHGAFVFRDAGSGEVVARGAFDRGLENGPWTQVMEDGTVGEGPFEEGRRHGAWEYRYEGGELQERGSYDRGLRDGRWVFYREDETVYRDAEYAAGEKHGEVRVYAEDGETLDPEQSGVYERGEKVAPLGGPR